MDPTFLVVDLNDARDTAAGELAAQRAMGVRWSLYHETLARKCAIIDAMTDDERITFVDGIEKHRIDEIASQAGVDRADVVALLHGYTVLAGVVAEHTLCAQTHEGMLAGVCPWCGAEVYVDMLASPATPALLVPQEVN
jgi:hypothetical protein